VSWPAQARTSPVDRWLRELRRAVAWRRRLLSAGLAAGSVAFALQALAPPPPAGTDVVVAARDLAAGAVVSTGDLRVAHRPAGDVPSGALTSTAAATGRPVSSAVRRGEVLTDVRLVGPAALRGLADGTVAAPVRVVDAESAALLRPGDVVDLLAASATPDAPTGEARLVASGVRVLLAPRQQRSSLTAGLGNGALLLVATSSSTAARLAAAAVTARLSVVLRGP
jgi:Flp pilus assembly protein CpaB